MFNLQHVLYMVFSFGLTAVLLVWASLKVKNQCKKDLIVKISALSTVIIHYSNLWVDFFANGGSANIEANHILPVYPCNVVMWMLLAAALIKNKNNVVFKVLSEFCFFVGSICGVIGIMFNANYDATPTLANYYVLKGLLSHSTMLFGCIYMLVGKYFKISFFNLFSVILGLIVFTLCGLGVNALYVCFGMTPPDGMFMISNPYFPVSIILLAAIALIVFAVILALYELSFPPEKRWYNIIKEKIKLYEEK